MENSIRPDLIRSEINVTPLVDVCLVLLIIFMVVAPMLRGDQKISLPETRHPSNLSENPKPVVLALHADGSIWVESLPVRSEELLATLRTIRGQGPHRPVLIKADRRLRYRQVWSALEAARAAGFPGVALAADRVAG